MELIDTHCHLAHRRLAGDIPAVLVRANEAGVAEIICAAGDLAEASASLRLARQNARLFALAGVQPHDAKAVPPDYLQELEQLAGAAENVAIGEIGLDYHYDFSPRPDQQRVFAEQLALATRLDKPVVIHMREAFDDTLAILRESSLDPAEVLFHSFTGEPQHAQELISLGAWISFSGIVTFKNSQNLRRSAQAVPADRLLIETDSPYLSPEPVRKMKRNEPANVAHVAAALAAIRGIPLQALAALTTANAKRFFSLP